MKIDLSQFCFVETEIYLYIGNNYFKFELFYNSVE